MRKFSRGFAMIQVMIVMVFAATFVYLSMLQEVNKNTKTYHEEAIVTLFPVADSFLEYAVSRIPTDTTSATHFSYDDNSLNADYLEDLAALGFDPSEMQVQYDGTNKITFYWNMIDGKTPQRMTIIAKGLADKLASTLKEQGYYYDATVVTKSSSTYNIEITFVK